MITRDQIYTMLMMKKRSDTLFSALPLDLIKQISDYGQNPNSDIATALKHAAYARQEDVEALLGMLDENPGLLLQAGNVQTPGGNEVRRVTLYEFLLGAGDDELAGIVQGYFAKIENGELIRIQQYERYRPHIESMLNQKPYDILPLIELIKKATPEQVQALLNKDMTGDNDLCKAFIQFRKDWAPKVLTEPCMHYNYASLKFALKVLDREWKNLYNASDENYEKINLVWRQLIGFEMRRLPGLDRCVIAQGVRNVTEGKEVLARTYTFKNGGAVSSFPVTITDDSIDGPGGDFAVYDPGESISWITGPGMGPWPSAWWQIGVLMSNKNFKLAALMPEPTHQPSWCVIS